MFLGQGNPPTRDILVSTEGANDGGSIGKRSVRRGSSRPETLDDRNRGVEDNTTFPSSVCANLNLELVEEVGANTLDESRGRCVEVQSAQLLAEEELLFL